MPCFTPGKVVINKKLYAHKEKRFKEMQINQPKNIKLKMRGHKLVSGVNFLGALKQSRHKTGPLCMWPEFMREQVKCVCCNQIGQFVVIKFLHSRHTGVC
jgi:hypothetical protein